MSSDKRLSFQVDDSYYQRAHAMPWGIRAEVLRKLLEKTMDAADSKGDMIYGAILGGDFRITFKEDGQ